MSAIAWAPMGGIVLPGYDLGMDETTRVALEVPLPGPDIVSHPQFSLHGLLRRMNIDPAQIDDLGRGDERLAARRLWVGEALKPAGETASWVEARKGFGSTAFADVAAIAAPNERAEAAAIAAALRETVHEEAKTAALVTTDRTLAHRVVAELKAYGITADDSGGTPFALTRHGRLVNLVAEVALGASAPPSLLAVLKHPLVHVGASRQSHEHAVLCMERMVLRGSRGRIDLKDVGAFVERQLEAVAEMDRPPAWIDHFSADDFTLLREFASRLTEAFSPMTACLSGAADMSVTDAASVTVRTLEALCGDDNGRFDELYSGNGGEHLESLFKRLLSSGQDFRFPPADWPQVLAALVGENLVKPPAGGHPRLFIWGALEARLQRVDRIVLGGLNEGTWPAQTDNGAFLTRSQKSMLGLSPPERRIGLSAHDFQMAMGQPEVVLSRSLRADGAPSVPSRWWQRLMTLAGTDAATEIDRRGRRFLALSQRAFARPAERSAPRPCPAPPVPVRPVRYSVTEIGTLKSDPYAVYARRILKLRPVDPLIRDPDASDRGTLIHAILEMGVREGIDFTRDDAGEMLRQIGQRLFEAGQYPAEIRATWWPRFESAIGKYVEWERHRDALLSRRLAEIRSDAVRIGDTGVTLTGRADRIDLRRDGLIDIIDYKTGSAPTGPKVKKLIAAQLPLEAALASRGGFGELGAVETGELYHLTFGARGEVKSPSVPNADPDSDTAGTLGERAWYQLQRIVAHFADEETGYLSHAAVGEGQRFASDYDHLARVLEWSAGGSEADAE